MQRTRVYPVRVKFRHPLIIIAFFGICFLIHIFFFLSTIASQALRLGGIATKAFQEADDGIANLFKLESAVEAHQQRKTPTASGDWSDIAPHFQRAARYLRNAPLPNITATEAPLINANSTCQTAVATSSERYLRYLKNVLSQDEQTLIRIDDNLARVAKTKKAFEKIARIYKATCISPIFGEFHGGAKTMSKDGKLRRNYLPGLNADERDRVYYYAIFPVLL